MKRRQFIQLVGGGVVVAATGVGCSSNGSSRKASPDLPWHQAGSQYPDPARRALSYAVLAPNPHNRQPWLVRLESDTQFTLFCQLDRRLPETDPMDRQILIGLGCFTELMRQAALADGYQADIRWFPKGEPGQRLDQKPIAKVQLTPTQASKDPLFNQVLARRSNKEPFDMKQPVSQTLLSQLQSVSTSVATTNDVDWVNRIKAITWRGHEIEMYTPHTYLESVDLMRIGDKAVAENPDGIDLGGPMMGLLKTFGMASREKLIDTQSTMFTQGMKIYEDIHHNTPAFVWIVSEDNSRLAQVQAGMDYIRLNLKATEMGLALHPVSQTLQEYPEMAEEYQHIHQELQVQSPQRIQMLARIGFNKAPKPSPRWPLETRILPN